MTSLTLYGGADVERTVKFRVKISGFTIAKLVLLEHYIDESRAKG